MHCQVNRRASDFAQLSAAVLDYDIQTRIMGDTDFRLSALKGKGKGDGKNPSSPKGGPPSPKGQGKKGKDPKGKSDSKGKKGGKRSSSERALEEEMLLVGIAESQGISRKIASRQRRPRRTRPSWDLAGNAGKMGT